ncbi:MAG: hypothetical protein ABI629_11505 [bacterium]
MAIALIVSVILTGKPASLFHFEQLVLSPFVGLLGVAMATVEMRRTLSRSEAYAEIATAAASVDQGGGWDARWELTQLKSGRHGWLLTTDAVVALLCVMPVAVFGYRTGLVLVPVCCLAEYGMWNWRRTAATSAPPSR